MKILKGDTVIVLTGKDKGKTGTVLKAIPKEDSVIVEGINKAKKHMKPSQMNQEGGIFEREMPIHVSNVAFYDAKAKKASKIGYQVQENGTKVRVSKASGNIIK